MPVSEALTAPVGVVLVAGAIIDLSAVVLVAAVVIAPVDIVLVSEATTDPEWVGPVVDA